MKDIIRKNASEYVQQPQTQIPIFNGPMILTRASNSNKKIKNMFG